MDSLLIDLLKEVEEKCLLKMNKLLKKVFNLGECPIEHTITAMNPIS